MANKIDDVFSALADSNRRQILMMLSENDMNVNSIAVKFKVSRPAISKHLKILTRSKLVKPKRKGRQRYYSLNALPLREVESWIKFYEKFWNEKLDNLEIYLQKQMKTEPFVIERTFNSPADRVWKALIDRDEMENWYFKLSEFKPEVGFEFRFSGGPDKEHQYLHICRITDIIPEKKLAYSWRYDGYTGKSLVTFELSAEGDKTRLKLTHSGLETFPPDVPDFARKNFEAGWTQIIGTSLKDYLEK